ncbi:MAG: DUF938 domain-containing protein [Pseudomonadota bacterium]
MRARPPDNPSAARNTAPILDVLKRLVRPGERIVEMGAGNAQHAAVMASELSFAQWQVTETPGELSRPAAWLAWSGDVRLSAAAPYSAGSATLDFSPFTLALSINTAHIVGWSGFVGFLHDAAAMTAAERRLVYYGPLKIGEDFLSEGNRRFDAQLTAQDRRRGIRDLNAVDAAAAAAGWCRDRLFAMPANNLLLVYSASKPSAHVAK